MQEFKSNNPEYKAFVESQFADATFIQDLGITLEDVGPGWIDSDLVLRPSHYQQDGFVHAGGDCDVSGSFRRDGGRVLVCCWEEGADGGV